MHNQLQNFPAEFKPYVEGTVTIVSSGFHRVRIGINCLLSPGMLIAHANVQDKNGVKVGTVRKVMVDGSRNPTALQVDVGAFLGMGGKVVEIKASDLRYEQDRNTLTTTLRKPQIEALPEIKG